MTGTFEIHRDLGIVEIVYEDETTAEDLRETTSACISMEKTQGINRFLVDCTSMRLSASVMDLYDLPDQQYVEEEADPHGRVAVIIPHGHPAEEMARFYETVCVNRGWMVRVFPSRASATEWLTTA